MEVAIRRERPLPRHRDANEAGAATTTGTVIGASVTDTLGKATEQLGPFQDAIHVVKYLLLGIAVVSIALTLFAAWHGAKTREAVG